MLGTYKGGKKMTTGILGAPSGFGAWVERCEEPIIDRPTCPKIEKVWEAGRKAGFKVKVLSLAATRLRCPKTNLRGFTVDGGLWLFHLLYNSHTSWGNKNHLYMDSKTHREVLGVTVGHCFYQAVAGYGETYFLVASEDMLSAYFPANRLDNTAAVRIAINYKPSNPPLDFELHRENWGMIPRPKVEIETLVPVAAE